MKMMAPNSLESNALYSERSCKVHRNSWFTRCIL